MHIKFIGLFDKLSRKQSHSNQLFALSDRLKILQGVVIYLCDRQAIRNVPVQSIIWIVSEKQKVLIEAYNRASQGSE